MSSVSVTGQKSVSLKRAAIIKTEKALVARDLEDKVTRGAAKFALFWDLMDTIDIHGYLRAAMGVIGRSTVGAWWSLVEVEDAGPPKQLHKKRLREFYEYKYRSWDNINDYQSFVQKLMIAAMYLRYFGRCAFKINRSLGGSALGLDFLYGYVVPNVDKNGYFKSPAFIQYPTKNPLDKVEFESPDDIVYITNPDWRGSVAGGSDIESLSDFAVPIDLYLQVAAREYLRNRDKPEAFYILPADVDDEAFDDFVKALEEKYAGPSNVGRSPIAVAGELDIKELSRLPADLPYQQARGDTRDEVLSTAGVAGAKLGLTASLSSANLREVRREFHESTMIPLFRLLEVGLYEQVHIREFAVTAWALKFNNPDFLTAVERATVHMRYHDMGALNPNEIRGEIGRKPRKDPGGDEYVDVSARSNNQGSPPEGREERPDAPSQTGEPTTDSDDPVRGDQHDDTTQRVLDGLSAWRSFVKGRMRRNRSLRMFVDDSIPSYLAEAVQAELEKCDSVAALDAVFDSVVDLIEEK